MSAAARVLVLLLLASRAFAQAPPRDTTTGPVVGGAILSGVVLTDETVPRALRRTLVSLAGTAGNLQTVTDDAGRFAFADLPGGRYVLTAEKPGFVKTHYGSLAKGRGPGMPIALAAGQHLANLDMRLLPGGVIAGTIRDEFGNPIASAQVAPLVATYVGGVRRLTNAPGVTWATTDDLGRYRIFGLPPGEFAVRASGGVGAGGAGGVRLTTAADVEAATREWQARGARPTTPAAAAPAPEPPQIARRAIYYPAAVEADAAELLTVAPGEERAGIDLRLPIVRAARIEGIAVGPGGRPLQNMLVGIANLTTNSLWGSPGLVRPDANGRFVLPTMLPGRYVLFGQATEAPGNDANPGMTLPLWTETEFDVNETNVTNLVMSFLPGVSVSGRLSSGGAALPADVANIKVVLTPLPTIQGATLGTKRADVRADGTFGITGVPPGRYRLSLTGLAGWFLRAVTSQGVDVLDVPLRLEPGEDRGDLVVALTRQAAAISGTLYDQANRPVPEFGVVVFSADPSHWLDAPRRQSGLVRLGSDGRFAVSGLPAGDYFLVAVTDATPAQLADPTFLEALRPGAIRITLADGEQKMQDLRLGGGG